MESSNNVPQKVRILSLDIESRPALAWIWDCRTRYVPASQIKEAKRMMCFAAKWVGADGVMFYSEWQHGREVMAGALHALLDAADVVLTYNGKRYDIPNVNTEMILAGLTPPSPYQQIDLFLAVKRFGLMSYSLKEVSKTFGTSRKIENEGFKLWVDCMDGDNEARRKMQEYNEGDVIANESLYEKLLPWINQGVNMALITGHSYACPACGSTDLRSRGNYFTATARYQRFRCHDCGKWTRGPRSLGSTEMRGLPV